MDRPVESFEDMIKSNYDSRLTSDRWVRMYEEQYARQNGGYVAGMPYTALAKAMGTGPGLTLGGSPGGAGVGDNSPLVLQNLDPVLTSVLFTEEHFKLWKAMKKVPSNNLQYNWDRRLRYGGGRRATGFVEGGAPAGGVSAFERNSATIRFHGVRRGITQQMIRIGELGGSQLDPMAEENRDGTLELMEEIERQLYFGQEAIKDNNGRTVDYDGLLTQMAASKVAGTNVINKQGSAMNFEDFEEIARILMQKYYVTSFRQLKCFSSPQIIADFSKLRLNLDRRQASHGDSVPDEISGAPWKGYDSNFGFIRVEPHIFFERVTGDAPKTPGDQADPGAPATPSAPTTAAATSTVVDAAGNPTSLRSGTYTYTIASFNESGESLPVTGSGQAASGGQMVTLTITQVSGAVGYRIYRNSTVDNLQTPQWIADVPDSGAGTTTFNDGNQKVPGTGTLVLWINDDESVIVPQFMPLIRWPIAIQNTTVEWFLLLYHTLQIKAPERCFIVTNVGKVV